MKRTIMITAIVLLGILPGAALANEWPSIEGPENFTTKAGWLFSSDLEASWRNPQYMPWEAPRKCSCQGGAVQALTYWREGEYETAQTIAVRRPVSAVPFYVDAAWLPTGVYDSRLTIMWEGAKPETQPNSVV